VGEHQKALDLTREVRLLADPIPEPWARVTAERARDLAKEIEAARGAK
jgi:hypothetical protein